MRLTWKSHARNRDKRAGCGTAWQTRSTGHRFSCAAWRRGSMPVVTNRRHEQTHRLLKSCPGDAEGPGTAWGTGTWGKFCRPDEATSCGPGVAPARDRGSFGRWAAKSAHVRPLCPHSPGAFPVFFVIVGQPRRIAPQMTHDDVRECGQRGLAGVAVAPGAGQRL